MVQWTRHRWTCTAMCQTSFWWVMNSWHKDYSQEEINVAVHWKHCQLSWCSSSFHISLSFLLTCWPMCVCTASVCTTLVPCNTNIPSYAWLATSDVISPSCILHTLGCNKRQSLQCNDMHSFLLLLVLLTVIHLPCNRWLFSFVSLCKCPFCIVCSFFIIVNLSQCHLLCLLPAVGSPTLSQYLLGTRSTSSSNT